jgi:hypothetical protein
MTHTPKAPKDAKFQAEKLQTRWPTGPYDVSWAYDSVTVPDLLHPPAGVTEFSASFSQDVNMLKEILPGVLDTVAALTEAICPYDCPPALGNQSIIWMESRGLGQQMRLEASTTVLFHTSGERQLVLAPPEQVLRKAHVYPHIHPNRGQSQLRWDVETYDRDLAGYIYGSQADEISPPPAYDTSKEQLARLRAGDVLYIPAFWGRQTFSSMDAPTLSLEMTMHPTAVGPEERPHDRGTWVGPSFDWNLIHLGPSFDWN